MLLHNTAKLVINTLDGINLCQWTVLIKHRALLCGYLYNTKTTTTMMMVLMMVSMMLVVTIATIQKSVVTKTSQLHAIYDDNSSNYNK